jgi:aldehyde dehydrogenase (NAD+)
MSFRTPAEAVELANNTTYGLAASVWTENMSLAHDIAAKVKAGTIWLNCTNQFDAASGFGGYRESGYGREGGKEGLWSYVKPAPKARIDSPAPDAKNAVGRPAIDRTHKLFIGGKQVRPDGGLSTDVLGQEVSRGNRKDVRNAVESAIAAAKAWAAVTPNVRAQVIYYLAENLEGAREAVAATVSETECDAAIGSLFTFAAKADKFDGQVHPAPFKGVVYTTNEALGVVGVICSDRSPLAEVCATIAACMAAGNAVVLIAPEGNPLPAVEIYRVLEASDVPAGLVNILTGIRAELVPTLVEHDGVDAVWAFDCDLATEVESLSTGNLKQTWVDGTMDWLQPDPNRVMRHATQVKNVWTPIGE